MSDNGNEFVGRLVKEAPAFVVWQYRWDRYQWQAAGGADDPQEAERLRRMRGGELVLPRGQVPRERPANDDEAAYRYPRPVRRAAE